MGIDLVDQIEPSAWASLTASAGCLIMIVWNDQIWKRRFRAERRAIEERIAKIKRGELPT